MANGCYEMNAKMYYASDWELSYLDGKTIAVIDAMLDMDEMVHPMVSGGSPVTNFLLD